MPRMTEYRSRSPLFQGVNSALLLTPTGSNFTLDILMVLHHRESADDLNPLERWGTTIPRKRIEIVRLSARIGLRSMNRES